MNAGEDTSSTSDQGAKIGVIETDTFCSACGFNLHTQLIWRDQRLGILVCRCPECGGHHAVGSESSVGRKWMQRFATFGVLVWIVLCVAFVGGMLMFSVGIYAAASDGLTYHSLETADGRLVNANWKSSGSGYDYTLASDTSVTVDAKSVVDRKRITPALTGAYPSNGNNNYNVYYGQYYAELMQILIVGSIMAVAWFACSVVLSACSWFWRRGRRWVWLAIPVVTGLIVLEMIRSSNTSARSMASAGTTENTVEFVLLSAACALQVIVMTMGIYFGRPIARSLLLMLVPPKTRQLFAFMWLCDGKPVPAARAGYERNT